MCVRTVCIPLDPAGMEACLQRLASLLLPPSGVVPRLLALPLGEDTLVAQLHALWMLQVCISASRVAGGHAHPGRPPLAANPVAVYPGESAGPLCHVNPSTGVMVVKLQAGSLKPTLPYHDPKVLYDMPDAKVLYVAPLAQHYVALHQQHMAAHYEVRARAHSEHIHSSACVFITVL